jgi:hypothetical protein
MSEPFATDDNEDDRCASCRQGVNYELPLITKCYHCETFKKRQAFKEKKNDDQSKGN